MPLEFQISKKVRLIYLPKGNKYKFNVINFFKDHSLYEEGLQPVVYSERLNKKFGDG